MADGTSDDDVIHMASFNIHRSQGRRARRLRRERESITISDDSDEEPLALPPVPLAPPPVPLATPPVPLATPPGDQHDDQVTILEPLTSNSWHCVIRPAALWGVPSERDRPTRDLREPQDASGQPPQPPQTAARTWHPPGDPDAVPSTSRDASSLPGPWPRIRPQTRPPSLTPTHTPTQDQAISGAPAHTHAATAATPPPALSRAFTLKVAAVFSHVPLPPAPAVLIAAAPERLGPPETGHRITLGSQAPARAPDADRAGTQGGPIPLEPRVLVANKPNAHHRSLEGANPVPAPGPGLAPSFMQWVAAQVRGERQAEERPGPSGQGRGQAETERLEHVRGLVRGVVDLFPDVQEAYVADLIQQNDLKDLNVICNMLLENPAYPLKEMAPAAQNSILLQTSDTQTPVGEDLFDRASLVQVDTLVMNQAADLLMGDFRMLSCLDIKWALNGFKGHYAITRKALCEALKQFQDVAVDPSGKKRKRRDPTERNFINFKFQQGSVTLERRMFFLENNRRSVRTSGLPIQPALQKEIDFYQQKAKEHAEHEDFLLALQVNEEQYQKDGQLIECGCCCGEFAFEEMTQCSDGHLFCKECLVKYAQEAVFGSGQPELSCMEGGCACSFPACELEKVLPEKVLSRYYERQAEEAVSAACADELVWCPSCNFPALLDKGVSLFSCPSCRKESCRKCRVPWKVHAGKTCEQVLENDEIRVRVAFEEKMTAARVRKCVRCAASLVKSEGCNRMSCRCGGFMCYLCRQTINGYNHFCQHVRSPGAPCQHCRKCSLWTDPTQDDERIIQEIQKEGETELNKKSSDTSGKRVGPPPEPIVVAKRPCPLTPQPLPQPLPPHPPQLLIFPPPPPPPPQVVGARVMVPMHYRPLQRLFRRL